MPSPPLNDITCPHPFPGTSPAPTHGTGERRRHAATINILPDEIFLEIFALYLCNCKGASWRMWEWRKLCGNVVAAMQGPFPVLTCLELATEYSLGVDVPVLPSGFLGGSIPCLQQLVLYRVPFPELPTLLLSARDLVSLRLDYIPPTGYISPEAMVTALSVLAKLKTIWIMFSPRIYLPEQRGRRPDPPMRPVLPTLTEFTFRGHSEYLEDLVAQIDAPRLNDFRTELHRPNDVRTELDGLDFQVLLGFPQLSLFICRTENLKFRRAEVEFSDNEIKINLRVDPHRLDSDGVRPHFALSTSFDWSDTHVAHLALIISQIFAMCSNLEYLAVNASDCHPGWHDYVDNTEWLAFFRLLTTVETLYIYGRSAAQVARVLEDVPGEMVTEVLPSLRFFMLDDFDGLRMRIGPLGEQRPGHPERILLAQSQAEVGLPSTSVSSDLQRRRRSDIVFEVNSEAKFDARVGHDVATHWQHARYYDVAILFSYIRDLYFKKPARLEACSAPESLTHVRGHNIYKNRSVGSSSSRTDRRS
ncbi:hypothetical protein EDB83DRAFT_2318820 [Lactarius deliciosus]|nr:hypothetical protein EDB83DRAFT_2318820 [Lactarius deliciosus]